MENFAYVTLTTPETAQLALSNLSGKSVLQKKIHIVLARAPMRSAGGPAAKASGTESFAKEQGPHQIDFTVDRQSSKLPAVNWNPGSKSEIRTSLGRGLVKAQAKVGAKARKSEMPSRLDVRGRLFYDKLCCYPGSTTNANFIAVTNGQAEATEVALLMPRQNFEDLSAQPDANVEDLHPPSNSMAQNILQASASEDEVITNIESRELSRDDSDEKIEDLDQNFREVNELGDKLHSDQNGDSEAGSESQSEEASDESDDEDGEVDSEDHDALMEYSNSSLVNAEDQTHQQPRQARVLADLSPEDLNAQLRYFHVTRDPGKVDLNSPLKCLVCAQSGHLAKTCQALTCSICWAFNKHVTNNCPSSSKCSKCRELCHSQLDCPYKLKKMDQQEVLCDLCQRSGHVEEDCELMWRTSGRPWESNFSNKIVRLYCYECGSSGHLGNDCPARRPGKRLGSSTWSMVGTRLMPTTTDGEMSIKGRAKKRDVISFADSDDDQANFYRPKKTPVPAQKGQIHINTSKNHNFDSRPTPTWTPVNGSSGVSGPKTPQYAKSRDDGRSVCYDDTYRPGDRRSRSPPNRDRSGDYRYDSYHAPADGIEQRWKGQHGPNQSMYRPMPSAAQNAWSRHRI